MVFIGICGRCRREDLLSELLNCHSDRAVGEWRNPLMSTLANKFALRDPSATLGMTMVWPTLKQKKYHEINRDFFLPIGYHGVIGIGTAGDVASVPHESLF